MKKPSAGDKLIEQITKKPDKEKSNDVTEDYASNIIDGVEVVDVKAIEGNKKNEDRKEIEVDKFGIPVPKNRRTWDKI